MIETIPRLGETHLSETAVLCLPTAPPRARVSLDDPASSVMTDLFSHQAITIRSQMKIEVALSVMIPAKVRLLLVSDDGKTINGVVSSYDVMGEAPLRVAARERIHHDAVSVAQIMTGVSMLRPLDVRVVEQARVRDIVRHLVAVNRQHAIVVKWLDNDSFVACGIFSAIQIGAQLGQAIMFGDDLAESFAELERLIA